MEAFDNKKYRTSSENLFALWYLIYCVTLSTLKVYLVLLLTYIMCLTASTWIWYSLKNSITQIHKVQMFPGTCKYVRNGSLLIKEVAEDKYVHNNRDKISAYIAEIHMNVLTNNDVPRYSCRQTARVTKTTTLQLLTV